MKIAVASDNGMATDHFGHCKEFMIFDTENNQIIKSESIPNPGHKPGFLPNYLANNGVNVIISGGMGQGAVDIFNSRNVEVILGATGKPEKLVEDYLKGLLESTGSICHQHRNNC